MGRDGSQGPPSCTSQVKSAELKSRQRTEAFIAIPIRCNSSQVSAPRPFIAHGLTSVAYA